MKPKNLLYAKFTLDHILSEQGRLLYSLLKAFSLAGYQVTLFANSLSECSDKRLELTFSLENLVLADSFPKNSEDYTFIYDKEDKESRKIRWLKKLQLRFDIFSPYWLKIPFIMPYPIHPVHAARGFEKRLREYRSNDKKLRIFFSGDTKNYKRNRIIYPKAKLTRLEIINLIKENMQGKKYIVEDLTIFKKMCSSEYTNKCVLVDTDKLWIDDRKWPDTLSMADFFLSPPGVVMPMCHNIIEAMAVGSIPITNYPEWFDPDLTHMTNCIVFDEKTDLIDKLNFALSLDRESIIEMRSNVISYYENYLNPISFIQKIQSSENSKDTVLMITEKNMVGNAKKLNRNSIIIRGSATETQGNWMKRLFSSFS